MASSKLMLAVARGAGVLLGVGGVDAVDLGGLQHHLGAHLGTAQRGRGVGGEEGVAGAGGKDHDLAFFQVLQRLGAHIGLDHLVDGDGRHHTRRHAFLAHGVGQGQRVHHRGQHAHVVGGGAVHADGTAGHAAKDVAAADDHRHLDTQLRDLLHLPHHAHDGGAVDAVGVVAHQGFARQLQQDALVGRHQINSRGKSCSVRWPVGPSCERAGRQRKRPARNALTAPWRRPPARPLRRRSRRPSSRCPRPPRRA